MDDQVPVRARDGVADAEEEAEARLDVSGLNPAAVVNTGLVSPGAGASGAGVGVLTWRGPFQPGAQARLVAEVGAGAVGDRLAVVGPAALASLQALVRVVGGYAPQPGAAFDGVTATGGITSSPGSVQTVNPAGNVVFVADGQAAGVVTFRAVAGVPVPAVVVSPAPLVNGGRRTAALFAVGLTTGSRAALVCDPCLAGPRKRIAGQTVVPFRTGISPADVRFPGQPPGAGTNIPFGSSPVVRGRVRRAGPVRARVR